MQQIADVIIVSCFGRGHWLAAEWASKGLSVTLVDVSEAVGHWAPEDWEGPFGVFRADSLEPLQRARLMDDAYLVNIENGFAVWTEQGVLELKGPISNYRMEKLGLSRQCVEYIAHYDSLKADKRRELLSYLKREGFDSHWLALLAHQLGSAIYSENAASLNHGRPLSLFSPWSLRRATRRGYEDSLKSYQRSGVRVLPHAQVLDVDLVENVVQGLEVRSDWSGIVRGKNLVWLLSSEESLRIHDKVSQRMFPRGAVTAEWCWLRYRVELSATAATEVLPKAFVHIGDRHLPWAHSNLIIVQKTERENAFDTWVRLPVHQRFQRQYLEGIGADIIQQLSLRLPATSVRMLDMPQEYRYDYTEVGPPRFPVFESAARRSAATFQASNVYFDGPEYWGNLDWLGQLHSQKRIEKVISQQILAQKEAIQESGSDLSD